MVDHDRHLVTFIAPTEDGKDVIFGRGDLDNPRGDAQHAFTWVDTPTVALHKAIVAHLDEAAGGEPITRTTGALVLSRALELAKASSAK